MNIIKNPKHRWLDDPLVNKVWLVKEKQIAHIIVPLNDQLHGMGRVTLMRDNEKRSEKWYIDANGKGFDGLTLMVPYDTPYFYNPLGQKAMLECEIQNLEDAQRQICEIQNLEDAQRQIDTEIKRINQRIDRLGELTVIQDIIE